MSVTIGAGEYVMQLLEMHDNVSAANGRHNLTRFSFLVVESTPTETEQDEDGEWYDTAVPAGSIVEYVARMDGNVWEFGAANVLTIVCALFKRPLPFNSVAVLRQMERSEVQQLLQRSLEDGRHARGRILFCHARTLFTKTGKKFVSSTWSPVERQFDEAELLAERARLDLAEGIGRGVASLVSALYPNLPVVVTNGINEILRAAVGAQHGPRVT